jgi:spermidine synthase
MNKTPSPGLSASARVPERWLFPLLLLFVGSGAAALIYEIVWFQLLQLVIGSSAVSLGILLGTFMGGMCLGSLLLPRFVPARHHPLRVYALIELGIGIIGILVLFLMPLIGGFYTAWGGYGLTGFLVRGVVAAVCLLPPTLLMGATLPAVARWVEATPTGVSWLGFFYGGNIAGAVFGCLLAGFYLLRVYDVATATLVAAGLNATVAVIGLALAAVMPHAAAGRPHVTAEGVGKRKVRPSPGSGRHERLKPDTARDFEDDSKYGAFADPSARSGGDSPGGTIVYVAIGLSGLCALAAEVLWTRQLGLLFGASVYAFSIILAVFLVGLGIGSSAGSFLSRSTQNPRLVLGWCQMLVAGAVAWTAYMLAESLPYWPICPSISSIWFNFQLDLTWAFLTVLPAALLWGASFPLALAAMGPKRQDPARLVGHVYAANTVGAIIGALGASLLLIAWIGSQHAQQLLIGLSAIAGLLMLAPTAWSAATTSGFRWTNAVVLLVATVGAGFLITTVPPVAKWLVAYGRFAPGWIGPGEVIYVGEGVHSSVAISRDTNGGLKYHNSGKVQASSEPQDMRLQRMLGHLTTLIPPNPRSVFVIGYGAGVTAGAVAIDPRVERVTIAEIEPLVPEVVSTYFSALNHDLAHSPKLQLRIDDGRHYLLTTKEKFDAITSDLVDPWVKGTAMLFTREFFEGAREHLNPGGIVTLFVQLYETSPEAVKSAVATFFAVFPNSVIFGNTHMGSGYDMVLVGQVEPLQINLDEMERRLARPEYAGVVQSLGEIGMSSGVDLLATYAGRPSDLGGWLAGAAINRDRDLRLQYLSGMGLNLFQNGPIYADMLAYRRFPGDLFTGSETRLQALWEAGQGATPESRKP